MSLQEINSEIEYLNEYVRTIRGKYLKIEIYNRLNKLNAQALRIKKGLI